LPTLALCSGGGGNQPTAAAVFVSDACFPHVTDTSRTETDANTRYWSIIALLFVVGWSRFGWGNYCFIKIYILFISNIITIIIIVTTSTSSITRARCLDTEPKTSDVCRLEFIIFYLKILFRPKFTTPFFRTVTQCASPKCSYSKNSTVMKLRDYSV